MNTKTWRSKRLHWTLLVGLAGAWLNGRGQDASAQPPPPVPPGGYVNVGGNADVEVLTRGPVHEAFAPQVNLNPSPGMVVPKRPPPPINEMPPSMVPVGDNVVWISGYWAWDDERQGFLWISGVARVAPPRERWIPGYWTHAANGSQWVGGFWVPLETTELAYAPCPPASQDQGPVGEAPGPDFFWVPGLSVFIEGGFRWRDGYWTQGDPNWVWVPEHYTWTPGGCVFVPGYWDYNLTQRGVLFAPVYFTTPVYTQVNYIYSPTIVVDVVPLLIHLWIRPNYCHYYFGDYYGSQYANWGIRPWFVANQQAGFYDPLFMYYRSFYARQGTNLVQRLAGWNQFYQQNAQMRPAHTLQAQQQLASRFRGDERIQQSVLAHTLTDYTTRVATNQRFERLDENRRREWQQTNRHWQNLEQQRRRVEGSAPQSTSQPAPQPGAAPKGRVQVPTEKLKLPDLPPAVKKEPPAARREPGRATPDSGPTRPGSLKPLQPAPAQPGAVPPASPPPGTTPGPQLPKPQPKTEKPPPQPPPAQPKTEKPPPQLPPQTPKVDPKPQPQLPPPKVEKPLPQAPPQPPRVEPKPQPQLPPPKVEKPPPPKPETPKPDKPGPKPDKPGKPPK